MRYLKKFLSLFFVAVILTIPAAYFIIDWKPKPAPVLKPKKPANDKVSSSALILAIDRNEIELTPVNKKGSVYWDTDQDEFRESSAWIGKNNGFLAIDRNNDGIINHHGELLSQGFAELSEYDENSDKKLNDQDPPFSKLLVWIDKNSNGVSEKEEIFSLNDLGITNINLSFNDKDYEIEGNRVTQESTFTLKGQTHVIVNASLTYDNMNTIYSGQYKLNPSVLMLPTLRGYGEVPELFIAMSKDEKLLEMIKEIDKADLKTLIDPDFDLENRIEKMTYRWALVENIEPSSRGENIDARKLAFLEKYTGHKFLQRNKWPNPTPYAANLLKKTYRKTTMYFLNLLFFQSAGKVFYEHGAKYNLYIGEIFGNNIDYVQLLTSKKQDVISSEKGDAYLFSPTSPNITISEKGGKDAIWLYGFGEEDVRYEKEKYNLLIHLGEKTITVTKQLSPPNDKNENPYKIETLVFDSGKRISLDESLFSKQ
ncbi:MAG: hypothetical protein KDI13_02125 [Alphaproteobacteria bacterium]|nr:hypothetical protein [Alphaproteobacteria bacterium]